MDEMFINRVGSKKRPGRIGYLITVYDGSRKCHSDIHFWRERQKICDKSFQDGCGRSWILSEDSCLLISAISMIFLEVAEN